MLNVLCWTEYVPASVTEGFTQRTGARVVVENYNSNEQMLTMLRAKPKHYDLVQPSQAYVESLIQSGGLAALDPARLPNLRHLDPQFRGLPHDPEGRFSVPWLAGTVGIVVNTGVVREPIHAWADVFSGQYRGRIVVVNDPREMVAWALASLGLPITNVDDASLARTEPVLRQWLPCKCASSTPTAHTALLKGDAVIGIVWSSEAALLWQKDHPIPSTSCPAKARMFLDKPGHPCRRTAPESRRGLHQLLPRTRSERADQQRIPLHQSQPRRAQAPDPGTTRQPRELPTLEGRLLPLWHVGNDTKAVDDLCPPHPRRTHSLSHDLGNRCPQFRKRRQHGHGQIDEFRLVSTSAG